MQINGPSHIHGPQALNGPHRATATSAAKVSEPLHGVDRLDISPEAELVSRVAELPEMRTERVADIRSQIAAGTYETDAKLEVAVGRLLDEFAG